MSGQQTILVAVALPLFGALGIALAARIGANFREAATLLTAAALACCVWSLAPSLLEGARPAVSVAEVLPGIEIAFAVEPLGMLFAALASLLWIINSLYSIGYMRGNREPKQTRFYVMFAVFAGGNHRHRLRGQPVHPVFVLRGPHIGDLPAGGAQGR